MKYMNSNFKNPSIKFYYLIKLCTIDFLNNRLRETDRESKVKRGHAKHNYYIIKEQKSNWHEPMQ